MREPIFTEVPLNFLTGAFLNDVVEVRPGLCVDPMLLEPWSCRPDRCRPYLGPNLCCKVERRCTHFKGDLCTIHDRKPFGCTLFPLDLIRIGDTRVVTTVKNIGFFDTGWCRYDQDMLSCFEGVEEGRASMFEVQRPVLARLFTRSEVILLEEALEAVRRKKGRPGR